MLWEYYPDGLLRRVKDRGGQSTSYSYDAHNNLTRADDATGLTAPGDKVFDITAGYNAFDELAKVRRPLPSSLPRRFRAALKASFGSTKVDQGGRRKSIAQPSWHRPPPRPRRSLERPARPPGSSPW